MITNSPEALPVASHKHNCPNCFRFFDCAEAECATDYSASCPECDKKLDGEAQPQGGELLPCPFCNDPLVQTRDRETCIGPRNDEVVFYWVECNCGVRGPEDRNKRDAEGLWNTRADLPRATAVVNCDYRSDACSSKGSIVYGQWICENHLEQAGRVSDKLSDRGRPAVNPEHESVTSPTSEHSLRPTPRATGETTVKVQPKPRSLAVEALEAVTNYFWGVDSPVLSEGEVQEIVEHALKDLRTNSLDEGTLKWAAQWIIDSLTGETNERLIEFAKNMATTLRAATRTEGEGEK